MVPEYVKLAVSMLFLITANSAKTASFFVVKKKKER